MTTIRPAGACPLFALLAFTASLLPACAAEAEDGILADEVVSTSGKADGVAAWKIYDLEDGTTSIVGEDAAGELRSRWVIVRHDRNSDGIQDELEFANTHPGQGSVRVNHDGTLLEDGLSSDPEVLAAFRVLADDFVPLLDELGSTGKADEGGSRGPCTERALAASTIGVVVAIYNPYAGLATAAVYYLGLVLLCD